MQHTAGGQKKKTKKSSLRKITELKPEDKKRIVLLMAQGWSAQTVAKEMLVRKEVVDANWREWAKIYGIEYPDSSQKKFVDRSSGDVKTYFVDPCPEQKKRAFRALYIPGVYIGSKPEELDESEQFTDVERLIGDYGKDSEDYGL